MQIVQLMPTAAYVQVSTEGNILNNPRLVMAVDTFSSSTASSHYSPNFSMNMSGNDPEDAPIEQELKPLTRADRIKTLTDHGSDYVPSRLRQKGRTQSVVVSLKKIHSGIMQRPNIVAPIESNADGE